MDDPDSGDTPVPKPVGLTRAPRWFFGFSVLGVVVFAILVFGGSGGGLSVAQRAVAALAAIGGLVFGAWVKRVRKR